MKSVVLPIFLVSVVVSGCARPNDAVIGRSITPTVTTVATQFDDADPSALELFQAELSPYGAWVNDHVAGTVWIPFPHEAGPGFVPYASHGHFSYQESTAGAEWVWVSNVPWGWATSHYGRWTYLAPRNSWAWVPGRQYAGAWVTFRTTGCAASSNDECIVGWGARAPQFAWRGEEAVKRPKQTTLFVYAKARDLFGTELTSKLLYGDALERASARSTLLAGQPHARDLGLETVPSPPAYDDGLRKALLYATPDSARAMGVTPVLGGHTFSTFVASGQRYYIRGN